MANICIRSSSPSNGAVALAAKLRELGHRVIISARNTFARQHYILNWGSTENLSWPARTKVGNIPPAVEIARNKVSTLLKLREGNVPVPEFWTNQQDADLGRGKNIILERHSVTGQAGAGIKVVRAGEPLSPAPLYVKYIKKQDEYRVHVVEGQAVYVQEKRRESDVEQDRDQRLIRNRDNGWVFCVLDVQEPSGLRDIAVMSVTQLGLTCGAVDMIRGLDGNLYVLEINTKPGLESPTVLQAYANRINEVLNGS